MEGLRELPGYGLRSPSPQIRPQALWRIGHSKVADYAADVLQLMKEERDPACKGRCAWVLGRLRHQAAYPYLVANLKHPSPQVRIWSVWALGEIGMDRASKMPLTESRTKVYKGPWEVH